ncbi:MAG: MFS transporter [Pseudomonadota bacterium]
MRDKQTLTVSMAFAIACGCLIAILTFGPRSTMGFFVTPMTDANGWSREVFALSIAIQNLVWGMAQPFVGMIADKYGTWKTLTVGTLFYALGMVLMAYTTDPVMLQLTAGVLVGVGIAGSAFFLVLAAFARIVPEAYRTTVFGLGTAAGSAGQFIFAPIGQGFVQAYGFEITLLFLSACALLVPLLAIPLRGKPAAKPAAGEADQSVREALAQAFNHPSYWLLTVGFFVCGFHVAFITVHMPPYIEDLGLDPVWGGYSIAMIGFFNIIGAFSAGILSGRLPMRYVLSFIYLGRAIVITIFLLAPVSAYSIVAFSAAMGLLWLSTIPPTQGLVATMFGTRYMAMLFGVVFFSHQLGSFAGIWLGGRIFDATGSYDGIWYIGIALGLIAALFHWPIREERAPQLALTDR